MRSNDAIGVGALLGDGIAKAAAAAAGGAGALVRGMYTAGRHLSSLERDVALLLRSVEIPVMGRHGGIAGVLCAPLNPRPSFYSADKNKDAAIVTEVTKAIVNGMTGLPAMIDRELRLLERQTDVEGRQLIVERMLHSVRPGAARYGSAVTASTCSPQLQHSSSLGDGSECD